MVHVIILLYIILNVVNCKAKPRYLPNTTCAKNNLRWYYDSVTNTCKKYPDGSCVTSPNRFWNARQCVRLCVTGMPILT